MFFSVRVLVLPFCWLYSPAFLETLAIGGEHNRRFLRAPLWKANGRSFTQQSQRRAIHGG